MINIFKGEDNDFSKAVCLNAAAGLIVNETHEEFTEAHENARKHILSKGAQLETRGPKRRIFAWTAHTTAEGSKWQMPNSLCFA